MDRPPPEPAKLLEVWMEWERGDVPPGRAMANLKTGGLRDLLEALVAAAPPAVEATPPIGGADESTGLSTTETWTQVV
jgi:hypothetical protein